MQAGSIITQLSFSRGADGVSLPAGNNLKLYLMNTTLNDWGSGSLPWDVSGAVLIYDGDPANIIGSTAGYKGFPAMQSFTYSGDNLVVFSEYAQVAAPSSTIGWHYNTSTTQPAYSTNQIKYTANSNTTMPASLGSSNANHANMIIDYAASGPCTNPPMAGTAESNPATAVCSGASVSLNLTGNTSGTGQTYQWQEASDPAGPYTNFGSASNTAFVTVNPTTTTYYRAVVTCNGVSDTSQPVTVIVTPPMSGSYTINNGLPSGSGNFQTFAEAINSLTCGINGPVRFDVTHGVYNEQVVIPAIPGASATNTITFKGNLATISFNSTTSGSRAGITLNGADHIIIDSLNVDAGTGTYGWGILLTNQADSNVISNCQVTTNTSATTTNYGGIVISGSATSLSSAGNNGNYNLITGNTVTGGYYGISAYGSTTTYNKGNVISNNLVTDYYYYSIYSYGNDSITISSNELTRPTRTSVSSYNLYLSSSTGILAEKNRMHNLFGGATSSTSAFYNIYISTSGTATAVNRLENNLVYNINNGGGAIYGVYALGYNYWNIYHNTIVLDDAAATAGTTYGIYAYGSTEMHVKNNIVYITRGGTGTKYALYYSTTGVTSSNNNVLYMNAPAGTNNLAYHSTAYATLADWQQAPAGYDQNSLSLDPMFQAPGAGDFKPMEPNINNMGDNVGVTTDILDSARLVTAPDPGAYEFQLPACTNPPVPGMVSTSEMNACAGAEFTLDLSGNSAGEYQLYQWQSSTDNINFTNIGAAQTITSYTTSQQTSTWYRAMVTCSGGAPVYSDTILVSTPAFVSGTFSINSGQPTGGGSFQTFTEAINHIKCGINGPVVLNVAPGSSYNEQFTIPAIAGTSATNTITINGNGAYISYTSTSSSDRAIIKLDGADYVTVDSLFITATGSATTEYGYGIQLVNDADHNTITRNTIMLTSTPATAASSAFAGIVVNSSGATSPTGTGDSRSDSNYIAHNRISGGYSGISLTASGTTSNIFGNVVANNIIEDFYLYGIYLNGTHGTVVEGNDISRMTRSSVSTFNGVYMSTGNVGVHINRNKIHDAFNGNTSSTSAAYGVYTSGSDATAANPNIISNNMIFGFNNAGTQYGIYNTGSDSAKYYFNSILLDGQANTSTTYVTRGIYQTTLAYGLEFKNNIIVVSRQSVGQNHGIYMNTATTTFVSDHNNIYVPTATGSVNNVGYAGGSEYITLADWKTGTSQDANSWSVDPLFVSSSDLHLIAGSPMDDKGTPVGITTDIDGDARDANTPDIGADEMPLSTGVDLQMVGLVSPLSTTTCYNQEPVVVEIKNNSQNPISFANNNATVVVEVTGATNANFSAIVDTGSLASGETRLITLSPATLNMSAPGGYTFKATVAVNGDVNPANDQAPIVTLTKETLAAGNIEAESTDLCLSGTPSMKLQNVQGYGSLQWQQSTTTGTGFVDIAGATDTVYTAAAPINQTMYYRVIAVCGSDSATSPEQIIVVTQPLVMNTTSGARCGSGTVTMSATANAGATIHWYKDAIGGAPLYTGNSFTTTISSDTSFFVSASIGGANETVGAPNNSIGTTSAYATDFYYLTFDVLQRVTIRSVDVYPNVAAGTSAYIEILNNTGSVLHSIPYTTTVASGSVQTVPLNVTLPAGSYRMKQGSGSGNYISLFRNTTGGSFPYQSQALNITGHNLSGSPQYYYFFYNWQISTGCESGRTEVLATVNDCAMPVTLVNFKGERKGEVNQLDWTTLTEVNNAGFELQRSADGAAFTKLAYVASRTVDGNSTSSLTYTFDDVRPFAGNSYYRLKQLDKDGKFSYSPVVLIKGAKANSVIISSIYPNPVRNQLNMVVAAPSAEKVNLLVTDFSGKVVIQQAAQLVSGDNQLQVPVQQLSSGTYIIKAICANGCETAVHKFVKQ